MSRYLDRLKKYPGLTAKVKDELKTKKKFYQSKIKALDELLKKPTKTPEQIKKAMGTIK